MIYLGAHLSSPLLYERDIYFPNRKYNWVLKRSFALTFERKEIQIELDNENVGM
jgi:hypothetical protein